MTLKNLEIEIFSAPGCSQCNKAFMMAEAVIAEIRCRRIELRIVNIVDERDYAVQIGLRGAPAIAINGKLAFPAIPAKTALKEVIESQLALL